MRVFYFTPYSINKELGAAYNESCSIVPNKNDYIALMDADTMFLSPNYGRIIDEVLTKYGESFGLFTCYATRIGNPEQRYNGIIDDDSNIISLKSKVLECENKYGTQVTQLTRLISGHFLLFKKSLWEEIKFPLQTHKGTILGIDNKWSNAVLKSGKKIARIDGLLIVHYYRLSNGREDKSHLL